MKACLVALVLTLLAACAAKPTTLDVTDRGVFLPNGRLSIGPASGEPPSRPQSGPAFELALAGASGKGPQTLYAGQRVELGDGSLGGPRQLENEADVRIADAWLRLRHIGPEQKFGNEVLLGFSLIRADFVTRSGATTISDSRVSQGLSLGMGLLYRAGSDTTLHGRYSFTVTGETFAQTHIHRVELAGIYALGRNVAARAGYSWWSIDATPPTGSELTIRLSGPALGLDVAF